MERTQVYVFRVRYANGREDTIQPQGPFAKWQQNPALRGRSKAVLISKEIEKYVECISAVGVKF